MLLTISGKIGSKILQKPFKRQVMLNELDPSTETRERNCKKNKVPKTSCLMKIGKICFTAL